MSNEEKTEIEEPLEGGRTGLEHQKMTEEDREEFKKSRSNWYPTKNFTEEERKEHALKAQRASAESRKRNTELRRLTKEFLLKDANKELKEKMAALGVDADEMSNMMAMIMRLFINVVQKGDLNSARTLVEWAGVAPLQEQRENEQIAKMAQAIALATPQQEEGVNDDDVIFYIPDNGREVINGEYVVLHDNNDQQRVPVDTGAEQ